MSYGKVHDVFWEDDKIETLSDRAALLALFMITGPHRNAIGCFRLGTGAISDIPRFGEWGIEGVSHTLSELTGMGFIVRDDRTGWTFIANALKHDPVSGNKAAIHALSLAERVPKNTTVYQALREKLEPLLIPHAETLEKYDGWPFEAPSEGVSKGDTIPKRSPLPEPEPSPEPEPDDARERASPEVSLEDEFEEWYSAFPNKVGRGAALKAFKTARKKALMPVLVAGLERYIETKPSDRPWCNPATWLNQERWLDNPAGSGVPDTPEKYRRNGAGPRLNPDDEQLKARVELYRKTGTWHHHWPPKEQSLRWYDETFGHEAEASG